MVLEFAVAFTVTLEVQCLVRLEIPQAEQGGQTNKHVETCRVSSCLCKNYCTCVNTNMCVCIYIYMYNIFGFIDYILGV